MLQLSSVLSSVENITPLISEAMKKPEPEQDDANRSHRMFISPYISLPVLNIGVHDVHKAF